jgi:hypothetical protein
VFLYYYNVWKVEKWAESLLEPHYTGQLHCQSDTAPENIMDAEEFHISGISDGILGNYIDSVTYLDDWVEDL